MRKTLIPLVGWMLLASVASAAEIRWVKTLPDAMAEARSAHKIVMIDFYTDWCGWCKKLDADTYPDPEVVKTSEQLVSVRVNAEKEGADAAKKYGVTGFPTIVFVDGEGNLVHKAVGYRAPHLFVGQMELAMQASHLPDLTAKASSDANAADAMSALVSIYAARSDTAKMHDWLVKLRSANAPDKSAHLAVALNAVGDYFQGLNKMTDALSRFQEAEKLAADDHVKAYALMSEAECYASTGDKAQERSALHRLVALGPAAKDFEAEYKGMLKQVGG